MTKWETEKFAKLYFLKTDSQKNLFDESLKETICFIDNFAFGPFHWTEEREQWGCI